MTRDGAIEVLQVAFKAGRKGLYRNFGPLPVSNGSYVILTVDRGIDIGKVISKHPPSDEMLDQCVGDCLRLAGEEDLERHRANNDFEKTVFQYCRERVEARKLDMKLTDCEVQLDRNRIRVFFTADQRTDFRGLVRDLAASYRARIEMRQIGVRDDARHRGGLGICGRELCCAGFLEDFQSVTLKMVRTQNLSLNPSKVSGTCGRLMCCLAYESEFYQKALKEYPQPGQKVNLMGIPREVLGVDIFRETVTVSGEGSGEPETVSLEEFRRRKSMTHSPPPPEPTAPEKEEAREVPKKRRRRRRRTSGAEKERSR
jgi:cell fate regulator YaaT (PSP1 superfamily)